jgi:hypothetical protein
MKERGTPGTNLLPRGVGLDCIRSHVTNYNVAIARHSFSTSLFIPRKKNTKTSTANDQLLHKSSDCYNGHAVGLERSWHMIFNSLTLLPMKAYVLSQLCCAVRTQTSIYIKLHS